LARQQHDPNVETRSSSRTTLPLHSMIDLLVKRRSVPKHRSFNRNNVNENSGINLRRSILASQVWRGFIQKLLYKLLKFVRKP